MYDQRFKTSWELNESQGYSGGSGSPNFASFFFPLEFQQFFDDFIGIDLEFIIKMILDFSFQLAFTAVDTIVTLH